MTDSKAALVTGAGSGIGRAVAVAVRHMASLPLDANVLFMTVMASKVPYVGRGCGRGMPRATQAAAR